MNKKLSIIMLLSCVGNIFSSETACNPNQAKARKSLISAIEENNVCLVKKLLSEGVDNFDEALQLAITKGQESTEACDIEAETNFGTILYLLQVAQKEATVAGGEAAAK